MTESTQRPGRTVAIFVDGPGGVGKTTFCKKLVSELNGQQDCRGMGSYAYYRHFPTPGVPVTYDDMLADQISGVANMASTSRGPTADRLNARDRYIVFDRWGLSTAVYQEDQARPYGAVHRMVQAYQSLMYLYDDVFFICLNTTNKVADASKRVRLLEAAIERVKAGNADRERPVELELVDQLQAMGAKYDVPSRYAKATQEFFNLVGAGCLRNLAIKGRSSSLLMDPRSCDMRVADLLASEDAGEPYATYASAVSFPKVGGGRLCLLNSHVNSLDCRDEILARLVDDVADIALGKPVIVNRDGESCVAQFNKLLSEVRLNAQKDQAEASDE